MAIKINNIALDIDEDISILKSKVAKKLRLPEKYIKDFKILKESIDARKKNLIKINYAVEITCDDEEKVILKANDKDVKIEEQNYEENFPFGEKKLSHRPVIIGMGPAGMFAGLLLSQKGYNPIIVERGEAVEERSKSIDKFWKEGILKEGSNVQFGEGGAGTFSDGKLTTRIKDTRCDFILEEFIRCGAPEEIKYMGKPHIGTDILKEVVKNIRKEIIRLGGEVYFNHQMQDLIIKDGNLKAIVANDKEIPCEVVVLSIGHSARDTYELLHNKNIFLEPKPFAIGVRAEHVQSFIDENQYGKYAGHPRLRAADYRLAYTSDKTGRGVYSFCMCPGGYVVAASSEENKIVTNGMSYHKRDGKNANSAIVVSVSPEDFEGSSPLKGMEFQRHYESLAYKATNSYMAPVQLLGDFMKDEISKGIGKVEPTYKPGYEFSDLRKCLPSYVIESLKDGFINFDKKIKGFGDKDTVLTGIETRTSAPVRITRNEGLQSISLKGLYPAGEGAGYAGGIISAAVDGLRVAESIMKEWAPII